MRTTDILTQFTVFQLYKRGFKVHRNKHRKRRRFANDKSLRSDAKYKNYARIYDIVKVYKSFLCVNFFGMQICANGINFTTLTEILYRTHQECNYRQI